MQDTREIFWNIGQGPIVIMYMLAAAALAAMTRGFMQLADKWRQGRQLDRFDQPERRFARFLADTFSQRRIMHVPDGGLFHAGLFWGFMILFAGTLLLLFQADLLSPLFGINLLKGWFYRIFSLFLDIAGMLAILTLLGLAVRRYVVRPAGLETTRDDHLSHLLLFSILITGFLIEGSRMAVSEIRENPELAHWSPGGYLVALLMSSFDDHSMRAVHQGLWWVHLLLGLGFIALIPRTKLRHMLISGGNSYLVPLESDGRLSTIDLEDEHIDRYGASSISELTWKDLYDADACTACKRCQDRCPAWVTGKPLSPMKVVRQIGKLAHDAPAADLVDEVGREAVWACTTCAACQEICPVCIEQVGKIVEMRRSLTLMAGEFAGPEVRKASESIEVSGNPFGLAPARRGTWAEGLPVSVMSVDSRVDLLYFAGCYASYDPRNRKVAESFVRICAAAGLRVGILGAEERCCGEPVRKLGNEYLYQMTATGNIAAFRKYGVKRIVTACPHCFSTLGSDYRDLGFDVPVEHHSTFMLKLIEEKRLQLTPEMFGVTFHDSCYLARYHDIIQEPRELLEAAGGSIREMSMQGKEGFCCGAGGGRILAEERTGRRISAERMQMAKETGMSVLASACPFCLSMFEDSMSDSKVNSGMKVLDIAEIIASRIRM